MAKIHTYTTDGTVSIADKIIGTDGDVGANNATKNFTVGSLQTFMGNSFAPKAAFETVQTTVNTGVHLKADGDILGPAGSITSTLVDIGTRSISTGNPTNIQQPHARLSKGGSLRLCGNTPGHSSGALGVIRAGHVGSVPTASDFGKFFGGLPGDGSGVVIIQNETDTRSSVMMLKSTAATSTNTVFVVGSGGSNMNNIVSTGYAVAHTPLLRLTGKADLYLAAGSNLNTTIHAKKFQSTANSLFYVEPAIISKFSEIHVNNITPQTSGHATLDSSIFKIPKASNSQSTGFGTSGGSTQAGSLGQLLWDNNYLYICISPGSNGSATWKRVALSSF